MTETEISVSAFADSLPREYRERFNPAQIAVHAYASVGRRGAPVAVALFPWHDAEQSALCVIAEDRPGLLSLISAALTQMGFDVDSAEAYTRQDPREAVDVFWLRDPEGRITESEVHAFEELLAEILAGRPALSIPAPALSPEPGLGTTVRFLEDADGALAILEVETDDRSGLLWTITRALYKQNVQIVGSKIRTENNRVYDRFTIVELDGSPIKNDRRLAIQIDIMSALAPSLQRNS